MTDVADTMVTVEVDGEPAQVPSEEVAANYRLNADLSRERETLEQEKAEMDVLRKKADAYDSLDRALVANPTGTIRALVEGAREAGRATDVYFAEDMPPANQVPKATSPTDDYDADDYSQPAGEPNQQAQPNVLPPSKVSGDIADMRQRLASMEAAQRAEGQARAQLQARETFASLQRTLPNAGDVSFEDVVAFASKHQIPSVEVATKSLLYDRDIEKRSRVTDDARAAAAMTDGGLSIESDINSSFVKNPNSFIESERYLSDDEMAVSILREAQKLGFS